MSDLHGQDLITSLDNTHRFACGKKGQELCDNVTWQVLKGLIKSGIDADFLNNNKQGAILYNNGSEWVYLSPGTSGQFLKTNGVNANPEWATVSATALSDYENIIFESGSDIAYVTRGFDFKVTASVDYDGTATITDSSDASYTIGDTVSAGDYLQVANTTDLARTILTIEAV